MSVMDPDKSLDEPYFNSITDGFSLPNANDIISNNSFIDDCSKAFTCRALSSTADNYSTGATFFVSADSTPRCLLEKTALSIFRHYTDHLKGINPAKSGAEWWTQVIDSRDEIGMHWDRCVEISFRPLLSSLLTYPYFINKN